MLTKDHQNIIKSTCPLCEDTSPVSSAVLQVAYQKVREPQGPAAEQPQSTSGPPSSDDQPVVSPGNHMLSDTQNQQSGTIDFPKSLAWLETDNVAIPPICKVTAPYMNAGFTTAVYANAQGRWKDCAPMQVRIHYITPACTDFAICIRVSVYMSNRTMI